MATGTLIGIIVIVIFIGLVLIGVPVCVSMLLCGCAGCFFFLPTSAALTFLGSSFVNTFSSYTISVAPMFMLMGEIASESGVGGNLFSSFQRILGRVRGGLASAVQVACALFGAICGSSPATVALMSRVAYPEMKKHHYSDELAAGSIGSGSSLATLIPPSLILISYGVVAEESIGKLFLGGIFVGIILMLLFIIVIQIWCAINPKLAPRGEPTSFKEKLKALREGSIIDIVLIFGFSMIGMFVGWFTPTESGAVGSALMLLDTIITKRFSFKMLSNAIKNSLVMCGMIYCLIVGATVLGKFFTLAQLSTLLGNIVTSLNVSGFVVVAVITFIFLIIGCFMDVMSIALIVTPLFLPILKQFGYDAVWFGVYVVIVTGLAAITPPVGMSCYIVSGITNVELQKTFKGSLPFIIAFVVMALIMALFPAVATWLPSIAF
jgi:tripartite ATP-independent transporter DctM subunit